MRAMTSWRWALLALLPLMLIFELGCSQTDLRKTLRSSHLQAPEGGPVVLAAYQPWFGRSGHIDVGYSSQDRTVLQRQIEEAKGLGITAFVVNWYGSHHTFEDQSYALMQQLAEQFDFRVALMYDEDDSNPGKLDRHGNQRFAVRLQSLHFANFESLQPILSALSGTSGDLCFSQG